MLQDGASLGKPELAAFACERWLGLIDNDPQARANVMQQLSRYRQLTAAQGR
ncbi:MAG: hypothetical protein SFZ23_04120 [Planctomycetota bacterium]|nr:hypothetical protein [Planctomycetota bacterium]